MKSNPLLKWLLIPMALLLVFVGIKLFSGAPGGQPAPKGAAGTLTPEEMKALGIAGDTPRDTVATLVAQVKQLRTELQSALGDNKQHKAENERLRARESAIDQRIQSALEGEHNRLEQERNQVASDRQQTQGLLQDLQRQLDGLSGKGDPSDLPVGLGLEEGDGQRFNRGVGGTQWVEPDDAKVDAKNGSKAPSFPLSFGPAQKSLSAAVDSVADVGSRAVGASTKAVYTVPSNSTLMGSVAMTALIGRVPIDGTVNDPYPFKVLIGPDNLTANGIDIPDVAGAVVSGTASGDWTLSCVRGQIRSVTFVFQDGTIRTVPEDSSKGGSSGGNSGNSGLLGIANNLLNVQTGHISVLNGGILNGSNVLSGIGMGSSASAHNSSVNTTGSSHTVAPNNQGAVVSGKGNTVVQGSSNAVGYGNTTVPGSSNVLGNGNMVGNQWGNNVYSHSANSFRRW